MTTNDLNPEILACIERALAEDIGPGDVTTNAIVPPDAIMRGRIVAKQAGVVAGLDGRGVRAPGRARGVHPARRRGCARSAGSRSRRWSAARALLTGERVAPNFLGRMSGIATHTRRFVDALGGTHAQIIDTAQDRARPARRRQARRAPRRGAQPPLWSVRPDPDQR
jgi:nicotinate-nucleotide pyrophosphorylase (carboxylating)